MLVGSSKVGQLGQKEIVLGGTGEIKPMGARKGGKERMDRIKRGFHAHLQLSEAGCDVLMCGHTSSIWHAWVASLGIKNSVLLLLCEYPAVMTL